MYLKHLEIKNVKCFETESIDFTDKKGNIRKWTVFLGNNGVGKSILLQIATLVFLGENVSRMIPSARYWVRKGADYGTIEATIIATPVLEYGIEKEREFKLKYLVTPDNKISIDGEEYNSPKIVFDKKYYDNREFQALLDGFRDRFRPICAYGPFRHTPKHERDREINMKIGVSRDDHIATMFNDNAVISDLEEWIRVLEYKLLKNKRATDKNIFKSAVSALEEVLPNVKVHEITDREILFETKTGIVPLSELSDGFRSTIAWTGNLIQSLLGNFPSGDPLKEESGIVVVDEIEIHLHPEGQRNIVIYLKKLFPNVQFITSSHSPFVPQALEDGESFVVRTEVNKTIVEQVMQSIKGWRVDQVLTFVFGLDSTRDIDTENILQQYDKLITKKQKTNEDFIALKEKEAELQKRIPPPHRIIDIIKKQREIQGYSKQVDMLDKKNKGEKLDSRKKK